MQKEKIQTREVQTNYPNELYCWIPQNPMGWAIIIPQGGFYTTIEQARANPPVVGKYVLIAIMNPYNEEEWYRADTK